MTGKDDPTISCNDFMPKSSFTRSKKSLTGEVVTTPPFGRLGLRDVHVMSGSIARKERQYKNFRQHFVYFYIVSNSLFHVLVRNTELHCAKQPTTQVQIAGLC